MSLVLQKGVGSENPSIQRKLLGTFQTAQIETSRILPAEDEPGDHGRLLSLGTKKSKKKPKQ